MKPFRIATYLAPALCIAAICLLRATPVHGYADTSTAPAAPTWNKVAAANYLDSREAWWQSWPKAQRDHGTVCISCHTTVPYAMARPALQADLHESAMPGPEAILLANVEKRVAAWPEMVPFYTDAEAGPGKTAQSRSTEAVMNAVILTSYDLRASGRRKDTLRPVTRSALDAAWALQLQTGENAGGWLWQDFHLAPWESGESSYQGAALLMLQLSSAPERFIRTPEDRTHVDLLQRYLERNYAAQPLLNQLYLLWASANRPTLLTGTQRADLLTRVLALQQTDGGWRLAALDGLQRADKTLQPTQSDGLATALVALVLEANANGHETTALQHALSWLEQHQGRDGRWQAYSLNKERDPETNIGKFMSDAATGYAVLALEDRPRATPW